MLEMLQSVVAPASSSRRNYAYYGGGNTDTNVRLAALKTANAIVAQGPPERLALVDELITSFDVKANEDSMAIRIIKLRRARASTLVKSLSTLLAGKKSTFTNPYRYYYGATSPDSETRVDKVTITAETNSNSVLVKGPTRQVKAIVGVIQEIDRESKVDDVAVRTYALKKADAGELATAMKSIFKTVLAQQSKRTGTPSAPFAIAANAQANTLVVTTTEAYFATVEKIIADFEDQPLVERDVEYVFLKSADAYTVALQLDELFSGSEGTAPSIETDAESNSLTLIGTETSLAMARKVIEKLDAAAAKGAVCVRVVAITDVPAEKMAEMLKRLYTPMTKSNVVIKKNIDEEAAKKDDKKDTKKTPADKKDTKKDDKKMPADKSAVKAGPATPAVIDPDMPTVTISVDSKSNSLLLSGSKRELDEIEILIIDLSIGEAMTDADDIRMYMIEKADPASVASTLERLFNPRGKILVNKKLVDPEPKITVIVQPQTRRILVRAMEIDFELIEPMIKQLDTITTVISEVRVFTLENTEAADVAKNLNALFGPLTSKSKAPAAPKSTKGKTTRSRTPTPTIIRQERVAQMIEFETKAGTLRADTTERINITANTKTNSVIVAAPTPVMLLVTSLIEELDQSAALTTQPIVTLLPLAHADALAIANAINRSFAPVKGEKVNPDDRVIVTPETNANAILIKASESNLAKVKILLAKLDTKESGGITTDILVLQNAQASDIQPVLQRIANGGSRKAKKGSGKTPTTVSAEPSSNAIVLSGSALDVAMLRKMAEQLDAAATSAANGVYIIPLTSGDAESVTQMIRNLHAQELAAAKRSKRTVDPLAVSADARANAVVLSGSKETYERVRAWVKQVEVMKPARGVVRMIPLKNADAAEVQKVINQMFDSGGSSKSSTPAPSSRRRRGRTPKAPAASSSSSSRVQVNIMESPRGLIVSANNEDFAVIQALVAKLEAAAEKNKRHQKIFTLENAPAFRIAQSLNLIYNAKGATTTPSQIVTITAVYGSNAVLVAAPNDKLDEIGHLIKQLDDKKVAAAVEFKIFPLTHAQPAKVIQAVTRLLAQLRRAYPREIIDVQADERTRSLIVTARPAMFKEIEKIIKKLDIPPANETTQVLIMPLRNANATQLAGVLNEMLRPSAAKQVTPEARALQEQVRRLQVSSSLKDRIPPLDLNQPIQITADPSQPSGANVLLLSSTPENLRALRAIVQLLDTVPLASEMTVQLFPLEHADATRLLGILETLHTGPKGKLVRPEETPALAADARTNTLVVGASPRAFESLVPLIKRLDSKQANPAMQLTVIPMEFNDAGIVAPILEKLFAARLASTTPLGEKPNPQDRVDIVADSLSNALIISASRQNLALIKTLLVKVDIEPPTETGFVRLYPLKNSDAARVGDMLKNLVSQGLYKPGAASLTGKGKTAALTNREKVSIAIDTRTNVLIVSASRENFAVLEEIIKKVDSSDAYSLLGDIRVFILKRADATKLGPTLQAFFKEKLSAEKTAGSMGQALPVVILPDARTNAILVAGSRESFAAVAAMIEKLDSDAATPAGTFAIIPLKEATATVLQSTLQQLFDQRATRDKNAAKVTVLADTRANALIIGATAEDLVAVRALIKTLDSKGASDALAKTVRVFPLAKADAAGISETLRELYRSQGGKDSDITISIDERINALIVSGGRADLTRIGEIVKQLDREKVTRVTEIRVFTLKHADATELSELMMAVLTEKPKTPTAISPNRQTLLQFIHKMPNGGEDLVSRALQEGVLITPDKRTNSLVVSATIESMPFLMNLISSLDSASPREAEIRVFTLRNSDAASMAAVLQQLFRSNQTSGTSRQAPAVTYTLTGKGAKKAGEKSMAATPAKTTDISTTTGSAEQADLNITVDARTNSLLIGGTPRQLEMAEAVIKKLDASEAQQRITRVYRPHNAQAEALGKALSSFLDQERQKLTSALGADRLGAAQRMLEREVAVVAEPEANVLLISASPRYFRTIFDMIRQLDQPPAQVLIQALLAEILLDDQTQFGAEWAYTAKSGGTKTTVGPNFNVEAGIGTDATGLAVSVTGGDLTFFLRALKSQGRLELLSRPQILAADNQPAKINVGQSVPLITASRTTDQGDTINTITYEDIGVSLDVLPRIGAGDTVRMEIKPEISSLGNTFFEVAKGVEAQSINTRSAETTVTCFDGQTIIMGGLITTLERSTEDKVPILGDVPLLGLLFRNTQKDESRNEFLVFLTPRIMRTSQDLANITHNEAKNQNLLRLLDTPNQFKKNAIVDLQTGALKESIGLGEDVDPNWRFKDIKNTINDLELNPAQWTRTPEPATEWSDPVHEAIYKTTNGNRNPARKGTSRPVNVAPAKTTDITPAPAAKKIPVVPVRSAPVKAGSN